MTRTEDSVSQSRLCDTEWEDAGCQPSLVWICASAETLLKVSPHSATGFFLGVSVSVHVQGTTEAITGLSVCTSILEKLISLSILFLSDPSRSVADATPAGTECLVTVLVGCVAPVL